MNGLLAKQKAESEACLRSWKIIIAGTMKNMQRLCSRR